MAKERLAIIKWRSRLTGKEGQGEPMELATAQAWVKEADRRYPEICHLIKEVT